MHQPSREAAATNLIDYPKASTLVFENLPNFISFRWDDRPVQWPSLEDVEVSNCPQIKNHGLGNVDISQLKSMKVILQDKEEDNPQSKISDYFDLSDKFASIEKFEINDVEELGKTLAMKLKPWHFQRLQHFMARNCDGKLNDFVAILLKSSKNLEHLIIKECKSIEYVFNLSGIDTVSDGGGNGEYLPCLKTMKLWELPQLIGIWSRDPTGIFGLGCLEKVSILKNLISVAAAEKLQEMEVLKLYSCEKVEEVVAMENQGGLETQKGVIEFRKLTELVLVKLSKLIRFYRGNRALEFPALTKLRINDCPEMIAFTAGFVSAVVPSATDTGRPLTSLEELELVKCDKLMYIISSNILPGFQNLKKLTISNCNSLKEVFAFHGESHAGVSLLPQLSDLVLTQLPNLVHIMKTEFSNTKFFKQLVVLRVKACDSLNNVILPFVAGSSALREIEISDCKSLEKIIATKEDMTGIIWCSGLKSIALENLPKLSTFSPGTSDFPFLERLEVLNCPALNTFVSELHQMKGLPASSYNCFLNSGLFKNLNKVNIRNQDGFKNLLHDDLPSETFCELKELILIEINNLLNVIPSNMLTRYKRLEKMTVEGCERLKEVFYLETASDYNAKEILPGISELTLKKLPSLVNVWSREPHVAFFENLTSLQIIDCHNLQRLFSLSTAKYLRKLKILKLYGCKNMTGII